MLESPDFFTVSQKAGFVFILKNTISSRMRRHHSQESVNVVFPRTESILFWELLKKRRHANFVEGL